jgi:hypothetical protein
MLNTKVTEMVGRNSNREMLDGAMAMEPQRAMETLGFPAIPGPFTTS